MNRKLSKKFILTPLILEIILGMKYTPLGKANAFRYSLQNSFQENPDPYYNSHINKVNRSINNHPRSLNTCSPTSIISPKEVINLIKRINPRKAIGPYGVSNKALRMLTLNAVTHLTKNFQQMSCCPSLPSILEISTRANVPKTPSRPQATKLLSTHKPLTLHGKSV
ncbi:hypothetical protein AVEN_33512-1 [Araneus ventricosus]|uniref:Uncharacterized protein n=1 Tax=Araneus ventricosus TaxID=182803 RepID=A0A4Y2GN33_ARAVE|nr:hypothetical protein AVEN_33512-1 [Araneus ventricosus]